MVIFSIIPLLNSMVTNLGVITSCVIKGLHCTFLLQIPYLSKHSSASVISPILTRTSALHFSATTSQSKYSSSLNSPPTQPPLWESHDTSWPIKSFLLLTVTEVLVSESDRFLFTDLAISPSVPFTLTFLFSFALLFFASDALRVLLWSWELTPYTWWQSGDLLLTLWLLDMVSPCLLL